MSDNQHTGSWLREASVAQDGKRDASAFRASAESTANELKREEKPC